MAPLVVAIVFFTIPTATFRMFYVFEGYNQYNGQSFYQLLHRYWIKKAKLEADTIFSMDRYYA